MRVVTGLLLALSCLPDGGAPGRTLDTPGMAGVPVRIFDLRAGNVSESFKEFMATVPMTNDRPVPGALIDDTVASLSLVKAVTPPQTPAYFVAAYIHKTPFVAMPDSDRERYLERYGEAVYPQQVCPIFIGRAEGGVPQLLSAATSLPAAWFGRAGGRGAAFDRLFALTEISHCGFIAGELAQPTVLPAGLDKRELRTILEALGDLEATAVVRAGAAVSASADEADVLFAARLMATFFLERDTPYTALPGVLFEYRRIGVVETHRTLARVVRSVRLARRTVREQLGTAGAAYSDVSLPALRSLFEAARDEGRLATGDPLADELIAALAAGIRLLDGDHSVRVFPDRYPNGDGLLTFAAVRGL